MEHSIYSISLENHPFSFWHSIELLTPLSSGCGSLVERLVRCLNPDIGKNLDLTLFTVNCIEKTKINKTMAHKKLLSQLDQEPFP